MSYFTLRLEPTLAKRFDQLCKKKGYKKTGILNSLVQEFVTNEENPSPVKRAAANRNFSPPDRFYDLVGIVSLGGDSVEDAETAWFE